MIGRIKLNYDWDWAGADAAFQRALQLEPANDSVIRNAAVLAMTLGRFDEAIALNRQAVDLDPLRSATYHNLGLGLASSSRWDEAEAAFRKALELTPQRSATHSALCRNYLMQSKVEKALTEIHKEPEPVWREYGLAVTYYAANKKKEADATLANYINKYQYDAAVQIAAIYAYRGEPDKAFEWLERAYRQRDPGLAEIKGDPMMRSLHSDPRWLAFLRKMNLPLD